MAPLTFASFQDFKRRYPIQPNDKSSFLGSGTYGRVIKVEDQLETEWVAIKISEFKGDDNKSLKAEVALAQRVPRQANIARYDACYRFETDTSVSDFAIMKYYADGNLADLFRREKLTSVQIYDITSGILKGLQHLHQQRIVHRDFKPANILISRDNAGRFIPKIADFGLSKLVSDEELDSSDFDLSDGRGTPSYKAPEQIEGSRVSFNLDLWAFGVILYEMLTGEKPFRADSQTNSEQSARREIEKKIVTVELPDKLNQLADPYRAIIRRCLVRDIHQRVRKEEELLDLLDGIPQLMIEAKQFVQNEDYELAVLAFEKVLAKREHYSEAKEGIVQCKAAIECQFILGLLDEADTNLKQQHFDRALLRYEQVLNRDGSNLAAIRGRAVCQEWLKTIPYKNLIPVDQTDIYQERTDIYEPPFESAPFPTYSSSANADRLPILPVSPDRVNHKDGISLASQTQSSPVQQSSSWRLVIPVTVCFGVLVWYFTVKTVSTGQSDKDKVPQQAEMAGVMPVINSKSNPTSSKVVFSSPSVSAEDKVITKRIDQALLKARQAYKRNDFQEAIMFTNSALNLNPSRQDVARLRDAAIQAKGSNTVVEPDAPVTNLAVKSTELAKAPLTVENKEVEIVDNVKEKRLREKKEQQETYEQLIEEGVKAISNGNNKAKAISAFNRALALAKENELNTEKSEDVYTTYMNKANKIFATDEFEGAKDWYQVARSVRDTEEVRRKIKQCTNQ